MQIDDIMTASPLTVRDDTTVGEAWETLKRLDVRHLPVVNADGELVGIVSDRDFGTPPTPPLMAELLGTHLTPLDASISTIMTGTPLSVEPGDDVEDAIDVMVENKVGAVPVVDHEGRVVGIVSYLDVLRELRAQTEGEEASP